PHLHSFPTRRSSDLSGMTGQRHHGTSGDGSRGQRGLDRSSRQTRVRLVRTVLAIPRHWPETSRAARPRAWRAIMAALQPFASPSSALSHEARPCLRSEEHTSELQSQSNLVCRLLLEKKKKKNNIEIIQ